MYFKLNGSTLRSKFRRLHVVLDSGVTSVRLLQQNLSWQEKREQPTIAR